MRLVTLMLFTICAFNANGQFKSEIYEKIADVPYADNPHPEQFMDIYWPANPPRSTLMFIHGGSLKQSGERRTSALYEDVCIPFAEAGVGCVTIDYRLSPEFQWPAMPFDVVLSIKKVQSFIQEKNGNVENLFLFGHSSGCTLASIISANPEYLESQELNQTDIKGVIAMGCILDNSDASLREFDLDQMRERYAQRGPTEVWATPEDWLSAIPIRYISSETPSTLVVIAKEERFAPPILEQGARYVRLLRNEFDVFADLIIVEGKHSSSIAAITEKQNETFKEIMRFIEQAQN